MSMIPGGNRPTPPRRWEPPAPPDPASEFPWLFENQSPSRPTPAPPDPASMIPWPFENQSPSRPTADITNLRSFEELHPRQIRQLNEALQMDGWSSAVINHVDIGPLLRRAIWEEWPPALVNSRIEQSPWYQTNFGSGSSGVRGFSGGGGGGGGRNTEQEIGSLVAVISDRAKQLGLPMTQEQIVAAATSAIELNWNDAQIVDHMMEDADFGTVNEGDLTALAGRFKEMAAAYMVPLNDETVQDYALRMARGELTEEGVAGMMKTHAKARWGYLSDIIDQGMTVRDYFTPVRDVVASTLEMSPSAIDLMDPQWMELIEITGEDGKPRAANMQEAMLAARKRPEWMNTQNSQHLFARMATGMAEAWGRA